MQFANIGLPEVTKVPPRLVKVKFSIALKVMTFRLTFRSSIILFLSIYKLGESGLCLTSLIRGYFHYLRSCYCNELSVYFELDRCGFIHYFV